MARPAAAARPARAPERAPRPRTRPVVVQRQRRSLRMRRRLRLGFAAIPLIALLFGGIVYVNSIELGVTKTQGAVTRQTIQVQEQIETLKAQLARRDLVVRNRAAEFDMVRPLTEDLHFIKARRSVARP